ncbi:MAG TPA: YceI family protein, partial [Gemmatimonadaceae bacterium]|nr:YceI family protein [Gemmatimonadaceae bacterium]
MTSTQAYTDVSTWSIDSAHSEVGFAVKHLMISTVKGHFADVQGTITMHESDPSRSSAEVIIETASIDTRSRDRDKHLRSADFFEVEKWPNITFRSRKVEGATGKEGKSFRVTGDLTIRDVTR